MGEAEPPAWVWGTTDDTWGWVRGEEMEIEVGERRGKRGNREGGDRETEKERKGGEREISAWEGSFRRSPAGPRAHPLLSLCLVPETFFWAPGS